MEGAGRVHSPAASRPALVTDRSRVSGQLGGLAVGGSQVLGSAPEDVEVVVAEVAGAQPHRTVALVEQEAHAAFGGVDRGGRVTHRGPAGPEDGVGGLW